MKANIRREFKNPEPGNRSKEYIGSDYLYDSSWYPKTSSCGVYVTSDSRIYGTCRKETKELKSKLIKHGRALKVEDNEIKTEWRYIIKEASRIMTKALPFPIPPAVIPRTKKNEKLVLDAMEEAKAYLTGAVSRRKSKLTQWVTILAVADLFESPDGWIYGIRTYHHSEKDGHVAVKMGKTKEVNSRYSAYATALTKDAEWEFLHKQCSQVNEKSLFKLLQKYRCGKSEVFVIPLEILANLKSLPILRSLIASHPA